MIDDTLALISSIKLLNKHLWGNEEEISPVDTYNLALVSNRLNSFLGWGENRIKTPKTFNQWEFWQFVCKRLEEETREEIKKLLKNFPPRPRLNFLFWLLCLFVAYLFALPCRCSQGNKIGGGILDPPIVRFIPLPGIEIGGCARNDSLIAPAI
ncbi:hypothetical protein QUB11_13120 [Microcoleus sp. B6-A1]|uniref:hypothetical protein n=1 Tax=Microcoleus sp. B6-A1 TaxID=2818684 RepID=UPI002FD1F4E7